MRKKLFDALRDFESSLDSPLAAWHRLRGSPDLWERIVHAVESGEVTLTYLDGMNRTRIPPAEAGFLRVPTFGDLRGSTLGLISGYTTEERSRTSFLDGHIRITSRNVPIWTRFPAVLVERRKRSTINAEKACTKWLRTRTRQKTIVPADTVFAEALERYPGLSRAAFDRAWNVAAAAAWKRPGKRKFGG